MELSEIVQLRTLYDIRYSELRKEKARYAIIVYIIILTGRKQDKIGLVIWRNPKSQKRVGKLKKE